MLDSLVTDVNYLWLFVIVAVIRTKDCFGPDPMRSAVKIFGRSWMYFFYLYFPLLLIGLILSGLLPEFGLSKNFLNESGYVSKYLDGFDTDLKVHLYISFGFAYYLFSIILLKKIQQINLKFDSDQVPIRNGLENHN